MNIKQLRRLVLETIQEEKQYKSKSHRRQLREGLRRAKLILEGGQEEGGSASGMTDKTNTGDSNAVQAVADALFGDIPKFKQMMDALGAGWGVGADKFGSDEEIESRRDEIFGDKETFLNRIQTLNQKLDAGEGFNKPYMPAFEGTDLAAIKDALDSTAGDFGIDFTSEWKDGEEDFSKWFKANKKTYDRSAEELNGGLEESITHRWNKLAGLLTEAKDDEEDADGSKGTFTGGGSTPFPGPATVMPGAKNVGNDKEQKPELDQSTGAARAYLTKGRGTGDKLGIAAMKPMDHNSMKPTQTEVKLGKTLAFALNDIGEDMDGSWADSDGNILDGHHRWSGQELRGFGGQHKNVNIISRKGFPGDTPSFLKMLSTLSAAIGRPTKTK